MTVEASPTGSGEVRLCHVDELHDKEARAFPLGSARGRRVLILRRNGRLLAWLDACPHYPQGTPMAWRKDSYMNAAGTHLMCHSHGALFDPETGACILGPCLGQSLQAVEIWVDEGGYVSTTLPAQ